MPARTGATASGSATAAVGRLGTEPGGRGVAELQAQRGGRSRRWGQGKGGERWARVLPAAAGKGLAMALRRSTSRLLQLACAAWELTACWSLAVPPWLCRIKAQRLGGEGRPATEIVELGAGPSPDDAYKVRRWVGWLWYRASGVGSVHCLPFPASDAWPFLLFLGGGCF